MITRRDAIVGACLATGGLAALAVSPAPRTGISAVDLDAVLPDAVGSRRADEATDAILLPDENLASDEYDQLAVKRYFAPGLLPVTMVAAYGAAQSYATQLHRPELCYPASGFDISAPRSVAVPIGDGIIPARAISARRGRRTDAILYWTRIGDAFPVGTWSQRWTIVENALGGITADGMLVRLSFDDLTVENWEAALSEFASALFDAGGPEAKRLLFGTAT